MTLQPLSAPAPGSPEDRGASDAYYGRTAAPHRWADGLGCQRIEALTPEEVAAYWRGFLSESDRKEW